jgi:hypothetical protein
VVLMLLLGLLLFLLGRRGRGRAAASASGSRRGDSVGWCRSGRHVDGPIESLGPFTGGYRKRSSTMLLLLLLLIDRIMTMTMMVTMLMMMMMRPWRVETNTAKEGTTTDHADLRRSSLLSLVGLDLGYFKPTTLALSDTIHHF